MAFQHSANISKYMLLSIIFLLSIHSTFAEKCGTLKIDCNTSDKNCYSGTCAQFASFFVGFNKLPFKPTPHPTITIISPHPINKHQPIPILQPIPTPNKSPAPAPNTSPTLPTTTPESTPNPTLYSSKPNGTPSSISIDINTSKSKSEHDTECAMIGEECTSAVPRKRRCCDIHPFQNTKCKFSSIDTDGFKIGKCCVMKNRKGCSKDSDCCNKNRICWNNRCLRRKNRYSAAQQSVSENAKFVDFVHDDHNNDDDKHDTKYITMSLWKVYSIFFIVFLNLYAFIYCYNKYFGCRNDAYYENEDIEYMIKRLEAEAEACMEYTSISSLESGV